MEAVEAIKAGEALPPGIPLKKEATIITTTNWAGLIDLFFDLFVTTSYQQKGDEDVYNSHKMADSNLVKFL